MSTLKNHKPADTDTLELGSHPCGEKRQSGRNGILPNHSKVFGSEHNDLLFLPVAGQFSAPWGAAEVNRVAALTWDLTGAGTSKMASPLGLSSPHGLSSGTVEPECPYHPAAGR